MLLEQCRQHNEKAQMRIYNLYYKAMFNIAYRIIGNQEEAEDAMQESFLKAFSKIESYKGDVTFGAWLKKIVINQSITEIRKNKKYAIETMPDHFETEEEYEPDDMAFHQMKAEQVLKTLEVLKPNYKLIITLFFIEGYDLEEITSILNISYENCRTMMSRAKQSLRKKLMHYEH
jgi:RNA polymerase sigma-70 factor (ECF subfamily)